MHGAYTTDPGSVSGTRMTTASGIGFATTGFVIGCGYAARGPYAHVDGGPNDPVLSVFRLSDGRRWELPHAPGSGFVWSHPLGITCTELFATVGLESEGGPLLYDIVRVKLDSLGPGLPAD
jgi:hypothetical protein